MDSPDWAYCDWPRRALKAEKKLAALRAENERLSNLVDQLLSETDGYKPYARMPMSPGWECAYCKHTWPYLHPEHHADDCPVLEGRAEMAEEG